MTEQATTKENTTPQGTGAAQQGAATPQSEARGSVRRVVNPRGKRGARGKPGETGRGGKKGGRREGGRPRSEFQQRVMSIRRVTRVMAGGRRFSFSVAMVIGDGKGRVGVGIGKANDTILAIEKATRQAKKNLVTVSRTKPGFSIPHDVTAKYSASVVLIKPNAGKGVVAGSSVRDVLELAGVKDVSAKLLSRSKNKLNNANAAVKALEKIVTTA